MNWKSTVTILIMTVLSGQTKAQHYPQHYFSPPLDLPLTLVGTFGEIRPDHFHTGIDLSTNEEEDKNVYASADGYVSRIKISAHGFGKALYITHPNGFVTVYAHLKRFGNEVQHYVTRAQYEQKSYEIELIPKAKELNVKKGDLVGLSGSTGDVAGPHLHFEIRDKETEEPINPLLFGMYVADSIPPNISWIRVFPKANEGILEKTDTAATYPVMGIGRDSAFRVLSGDYIQAFGNIGFGIEATDHQQHDGAPLGIYSLQLRVDSFVVYEYRMDRLNFNDTRYSNAHIDYLSKKRDDITIQRCFRLPGNRLKIYSDPEKTGIVNFSEDASHEIEFVVKDFNGNKSTLNFPVLTYTSLAEYPSQPAPEGAVLVTYEKGINIHKPNVEITIPAGAVYDDYYFSASESKKDKSMFCPVYHIGNRYVPVHTSINLGIKPPDFPDSLKSKAVLVSIDYYGNFNDEGGSWTGNLFSAKVRHFGDFTMAVDTTPPTIKKEYYPADLNSAHGAIVEFMISDNLSGIKTYNAFVDGQWLLMEYNVKNNLLSGEIGSLPQNNLHKIEVMVTDEKGNEAMMNDSFYY